jgi:hypothetical protein
MVIPEKKTVVCSYPKAGTTTAKWLILALLGYKKASICSEENILGVHLNHEQYYSKGMLKLSER